MKLSELEGASRKEVRALTDRLLVSAIKKARELYYEKGKSPLGDATFDRLEDELERRDPKHKLLTQAVGTKVEKGGSRKVKLPYPLYSLTKIKPTNVKAFESWVDHYVGPYVASDKEDGNSLEILYKDHKPWKVFTRGDGKVGQDVSVLIPYLDIPARVSEADLVIRVEITMSRAAFKKVGDGAENPRNFVAGLVNRRNGDRSALKRAKVVALEIISPRMKPSVALKKLKSMGFEVVPHTLIPKGRLTLSLLAKLFATRRKSSKRDIDGIVIESDTINKRPPPGTKSPDYMFAFKMGEADDSAVVKVEDVKWEESKYGTLVPVVIFPKTRLAGVNVTRASGHNAFFIVNGFRYKDIKKKLPKHAIGPGATVTLTRSGDVIPHIVSVEKGAKKPALPKVPFVWDAKGVNIKLVGTTDKMRDRRIASFFSTIGVDGIKIGTVERLAEAGYTSIIKILRATADDFMDVPGFKERSATKLYDAIQAKTRQVELPTLMDASGMFGAGLGTRRATDIVNAYPNLLSAWAKLSPAQIVAKITAIHGFQSKTAEPVGKNFAKFLVWLKKSRIKPVLPKKVKAKGAKLNDQAVCFTGFRDKDLERKIVEQGGKIASGVNKNTTILIYAPGKSSSKLVAAKKLGIDAYTRDQFTSKYKL